MHVYVIAEAGVNHNGKYELACKLIEEAKAAGADCIKFQTFVSEKLVSKDAQIAEYQMSKNRDSSQMNMLKNLELPFEDFTKLKDYCDRIGIAFLSTPFDFDSIEFLKTIDMPFWKIPSGEITNYPYLVTLARTEKPIVMSTGMCEMEDVRKAIEVLRKNGSSSIKLLHCNSEYPTPFEDVNLLAMNSLKEEFGCEVGYSDHTKGIEVPIAAVALGALIVEKHFTLDRNMEGPDHKASLEPPELKRMVDAIRNIEKALGSNRKTVSKSEEKNKNVVRKSIVAACEIHKGERFSEKNLTTKRPGNGISPMMWENVVGEMAKRNFDKDEMIEI